MDALLTAVLAEPRSYAIFGLGLDAAGAVLIAVTALSPVKSDLYFGDAGGHETDRSLAGRRRMVILGASLLFIGFCLQIAANCLQLGE